MNFDGILLLNKPRGITSFDLVKALSRKLNLKVGHAGTLDPLACGLMILLIGEGTKFSQFFQNLSKTYIARARLGIRTDSYDMEGRVLEEKDSYFVNENLLIEIIEKFKGKIKQIPPSFSAKKIDGERAYKLARKGNPVFLKEIYVFIYDIKLLEFENPYFTIECEVSSGTYIRSLIDDIGKELGSFAVLESLTRTKIGKFSLLDSKNIESFSQKDIIPIDKALYFLESINLDSQLGKIFYRGKSINVSSNKEGILKVFVNNLFIGIGELKDNVLKPVRLLSHSYLSNILQD